MKKILAGGIVFLMVLLLGNIVYAQRVGMRKGEIFIGRATPGISSWKIIPKRGNVPFKYRITTELWREFNFSKDQITAFQKLKLDFQKEMLGLKKDLETKLLEYKNLLWEETLDKEKLELLIKEIGQIREELERKILEYQVELRKILTPEQLNKLRFLFFFGDKKIKERGRRFFNLR